SVIDPFSTFAEAHSQPSSPSARGLPDPPHPQGRRGSVIDPFSSFEAAGSHPGKARSGSVIDPFSTFAEAHSQPSSPSARGLPDPPHPQGRRGSVIDPFSSFEAAGSHPGTTAGKTRSGSVIDPFSSFEQAPPAGAAKPRSGSVIDPFSSFEQLESHPQGDTRKARSGSVMDPSSASASAASQPPSARVDPFSSFEPATAQQPPFASGGEGGAGDHGGDVAKARRGSVIDPLSTSADDGAARDAAQPELGGRQRQRGRSVVDPSTVSDHAAAGLGAPPEQGGDSQSDAHRARGLQPHQNAQEARGSQQLQNGQRQHRSSESQRTATEGVDSADDAEHDDGKLHDMLEEEGEHFYMTDFDVEENCGDISLSRLVELKELLAAETPGTWGLEALVEFARGFEEDVLALGAGRGGGTRFEEMSDEGVSASSFRSGSPPPMDVSPETTASPSCPSPATPPTIPPSALSPLLATPPAAVFRRTQNPAPPTADIALPPPSPRTPRPPASRQPAPFVLDRWPAPGNLDDPHPNSPKPVALEIHPAAREVTPPAGGEEEVEEVEEEEEEGEGAENAGGPAAKGVFRRVATFVAEAHEALRAAESVHRAAGGPPARLGSVPGDTCPPEGVMQAAESVHSGVSPTRFESEPEGAMLVHRASGTGGEPWVPPEDALLPLQPADVSDSQSPAATPPDSPLHRTPADDYIPAVEQLKAYRSQRRAATLPPASSTADRAWTFDNGHPGTPSGSEDPYGDSVASRPYHHHHRLSAAARSRLRLGMPPPNCAQGVEVRGGRRASFSLGGEENAIPTRPTGIFPESVRCPSGNSHGGAQDGAAAFAARPGQTGHPGAAARRESRSSSGNGGGRHVQGRSFPSVSEPGSRSPRDGHRSQSFPDREHSVDSLRSSCSSDSDQEEAPRGRRELAYRGGDSAASSDQESCAQRSRAGSQPHSGYELQKMNEWSPTKLPSPARSRSTLQQDEPATAGLRQAAARYFSGEFSHRNPPTGNSHAAVDDSPAQFPPEKSSRRILSSHAANEDWEFEDTSGRGLRHGRESATEGVDARVVRAASDLAFAGGHAAGLDSRGVLASSDSAFAGGQARAPATSPAGLRQTSARLEKTAYRSMTVPPDPAPAALPSTSQHHPAREQSPPPRGSRATPLTFAAQPSGELRPSPSPAAHGLDQILVPRPARVPAAEGGHSRTDTAQLSSWDRVRSASLRSPPAVQNGLARGSPEPSVEYQGLLDTRSSVPIPGAKAWPGDPVVPLHVQGVPPAAQPKAVPGRFAQRTRKAAFPEAGAGVDGGAAANSAAAAAGRAGTPPPELSSPVLPSFSPANPRAGRNYPVPSDGVDGRAAANAAAAAAAAAGRPGTPPCAAARAPPPELSSPVSPSFSPAKPGATRWFPADGGGAAANAAAPATPERCSPVSPSFSPAKPRPVASDGVDGRAAANAAAAAGQIAPVTPERRFSVSPSFLPAKRGVGRFDERARKAAFPGAGANGRAAPQDSVYVLLPSSYEPSAAGGGHDVVPMQAAPLASLSDGEPESPEPQRRRPPSNRSRRPPAGVVICTPLPMTSSSSRAVPSSASPYFSSPPHRRDDWDTVPTIRY
ncbi:hypothetical protein DIPPA_01453, partial [Diplonema papillatum]